MPHFENIETSLSVDIPPNESIPQLPLWFYHTTKKIPGSSHQWFHNIPNNLLFWSKFWACYVCHFLGTAQFTTQGQATHAKDNLGLDDFKAVQALHLTIHKEFTTKFSKLHILHKNSSPLGFLSQSYFEGQEARQVIATQLKRRTLNPKAPPCTTNAPLEYFAIKSTPSSAWAQHKTDENMNFIMKSWEIKWEKKSSKVTDSSSFPKPPDSISCLPVFQRVLCQSPPGWLSF